MQPQKKYSEQEIQRHKKKKPQVSKSNHRSDHKHEYEKVIMPVVFGYGWRNRCRICGRIESCWKYNTGYEYRKQFMYPEYWDKHSTANYMFLSPEELKQKYPDTRVFKLREGKKIWEEEAEFEEVI